jgi:phosphotriesterase-related protein
MSKRIVTVQGPIDPQELGLTLVHEHLLVDFAGARSISRDRYDRNAVHHKMLPFLLQIKAQGVSAFADCTPAYLGRDPLLLRGLAEESGLHLLTNTGLYAAGERKGSPEPYLPPYAYELSAEALAGGWLKEWYEGIEGTDIRPGFIKIGVNRGELRPISKKIVEAAILTSRHSGLAVACHTVKGVAALQILRLFEQAKVAPDRFVFVHAQGEDSLEMQLECARQGAWIEYDGVGPKTTDTHLKLVLFMLERGFEDQLLISQDAGWYRPGEPDGGEIRGFEYLCDHFVPRLLDEGVPAATIDHLLIQNPRRMFELNFKGSHSGAFS